MRTFWMILVLGLPLVLTSQASGQAHARRFLQGEWIETARVGGLESPLMMPGLMKAADDFFVVYDYSEKAIQAFSYEGELIWQAGRAGAGPNEFGNPTDLQVGPSNTVWITDPENVRLTILDSAGAFVRLVRLPPTLFRCAPINEDSCWGASSDIEVMLARVDLTRGVQEVIPVADWLRDVHLFSREAVLHAAREDRVVLGYLYHDRWVLLEPGKPRSVRRGVEEVPFAKMLQWRTKSGHHVIRIDTAAVEAARSIAVSGGVVHFLFGAGETHPTDLVDTYDLDTGRYQGSYRLPEKVDRLAVSPTGMVVTLVRDPVPTVRVWRFSGVTRTGRVPDGR